MDWQNDYVYELVSTHEFYRVYRRSTLLDVMGVFLTAEEFNELTSREKLSTVYEGDELSMVDWTAITDKIKMIMSDPKVKNFNTSIFTNHDYVAQTIAHSLWAHCQAEDRVWFKSLKGKKLPDGSYLVSRTIAATQTPAKQKAKIESYIRATQKIWLKYYMKTSLKWIVGIDKCDINLLSNDDHDNAIKLVKLLIADVRYKEQAARNLKEESLFGKINAAPETDLSAEMKIKAKTEVTAWWTDLFALNEMESGEKK